MKRLGRICRGLAVVTVLASASSAALASGPGGGSIGVGRSLGGASRSFSGGGGGGGSGGVSRNITKSPSLGGLKTGPSFNSGNVSRIAPKTTMPINLGSKGPSLGGSLSGNKIGNLPIGNPIGGSKSLPLGGSKSLPLGGNKQLTILPHPHHDPHHHDHHDHHHHHHPHLPAYCHSWWPVYGGGGGGTVIVQEQVPVIVQVPVPVAVPAPAAAAAGVATIPPAPMGGPVAAEPKAAATPAGPENVPQLKLGGTYEFPASLGKDQGGVVLKLNGVSLGCFVKKWTPASVTSTLPLLGIESPTKAELAVLLPDGSVAQTYAVEVLPLENEPATQTAAK